MRFASLTLFLGLIGGSAAAGGQYNVSAGAVTPQCSQDIHGATEDLTSAGIDIARAVDDCADGFTAECNDEISNVLNDLTSAAQHITDAVYDCSGTEPTPCSADVNAILVDITEATTAIMDAVIDCPVSGAKCTADIARASKAIGAAIRDITAAANDC
jgi:hypothetical protein